MEAIQAIVQYISQHLGAFLGVAVAPLSAYLTIYFMERSKRRALIRGMYGELQYNLELIKSLRKRLKYNLYLAEGLKLEGKGVSGPTVWIRTSYIHIKRLRDEFYFDFYKINKLATSSQDNYGPLNQLLLEEATIGSMIRFTEFSNVEFTKDDSKEGAKGNAITLTLVEKKLVRTFGGLIPIDRVEESLRIQEDCIRKILNVLESYWPYKWFLRNLLKDKNKTS